MQALRHSYTLRGILVFSKPISMFTVVGALAIIGGALPLIKQGAEAQDPRRQKARKQSQIDPVTAVLQAA